MANKIQMNNTMVHTSLYSRESVDVRINMVFLGLSLSLLLSDWLHKSLDSETDNNYY